MKLNMKINKDETTEQAILAAAEEEFMEKGFGAAKTTDIAKRVGVNQALVHYYFRTKENLFDKVFQKKVGELVGSFMTIIGGDLPFFEKMKDGVEAHFDFIAANPRLPFFILREFLTNEERMGKFREVFLPVISGVAEKLEMNIREEQAKGTVGEVDARTLIIDIVSLNVFVFISRPVMQAMAEAAGQDFPAFLEHRKKENVELIMRRLKKSE